MNTQETLPNDDEIDVLACEWDKRPRGAPSFDDLHTAIRAVWRETETLSVTYSPTSAADVDALAAAEQLCCPTIQFTVSREPAPILTIRATPAQLDIFEQFLTN